MLVVFGRIECAIARDFGKDPFECRKKKAPPSRGRSAWRVEEESLSAVDRVTHGMKFVYFIRLLCHDVGFALNNRGKDPSW